jgi:hypothetical protein
LCLGAAACALVLGSVLAARVGLAVWGQALLGAEYLGALFVRHGVAGLEPAAAGALLLAVGELVTWAVDAGAGRRDEPAVHVARGTRLGLLLVGAAALAAVPLVVAGAPVPAGPLPVVVGVAAVVGAVALVTVLVRR